ncbi:MAG: alpha/beta hydrolase [Alphaproteobacteria bacterium]|nr:alpha/beta hydrolase [Alphaproteobacteria bacterium]
MFVAGFLLLPLLGGCAPNVLTRTDAANRFAGPAFMSKRTIAAPPFHLTAYERIDDTGAPAMVYIEGDGLAWMNKREPSLDPTPRTPLALGLAARDKSPNVIYLARPCQYTKLTEPGPCGRRYWTSARFAPETVESLSVALDRLKALHGIPAFHLVGYSGGGAMAALLAEQRDDIASLRTVAGNLDHESHSRLHGISPLRDSLNPVTDAARLASLPQHHFIGGADQNVTPVIFENFRTAVGPSSCVRASLIPGVTHEDGWIERWPALLKEPLDCAVPPGPAGMGS